MTYCQHYANCKLFSMPTIDVAYIFSGCRLCYELGYPFYHIIDNFDNIKPNKFAKS